MLVSASSTIDASFPSSRARKAGVRHLLVVHHRLRLRQRQPPTGRVRAARRARRLGRGGGEQRALRAFSFASSGA